jgi:hypothetical protein
MMRNQILILLFLFSFPYVINGQSYNRTYQLKGPQEDAANCFKVVELTIHDDGTFSRIAYGCGEKKNWKNYKNWKTQFINGKISGNGKYNILTQYKDSFKTDFSWTVKISDKRVFYYAPNKNNVLKKTAKYKRI